RAYDDGMGNRMDGDRAGGGHDCEDRAGGGHDRDGHAVGGHDGGGWDMRIDSLRQRRDGDSNPHPAALPTIEPPSAEPPARPSAAADTVAADPAAAPASIELSANPTVVSEVE